LEQMRAHLTVTDEDFEVARVEEKSRRHVRFPPNRRFTAKLFANQNTARMSWR
jgi:hypothetical protein